METPPPPGKPERKDKKKKWERPRMETGRLFEPNTSSCLTAPASPLCVGHAKT
jgi:hypothetical protein